MRRRSPVDLEVNHDRWLVSYSDFVTLLFAFFVVMYSISQVSEGKYRVLSNELMETFAVPSSAIATLEEGDPDRTLDPDTLVLPLPSEPAAGQGSADAVTDSQQSPAPQPAEDQGNYAGLGELSREFSRQFSGLVDDELVTVNGNERWLELELQSSILFPTGSADPSLQAKAIFEEVSTLLARYDNPVQVEGFTDNVPIHNRRFKSNWELSSARAASVVKLLANNGVDPARLSAVGYGEHRPVADNATPEGRAKNRRVVLMVSRQASERPALQTTEQGTGEQTKRAEATEQTPSVATAEDTGTSPTADTAKENVESAAEQPRIQPIQLQNGGLLFTSDPDLPRANTTPRRESDGD